VPSCVLRVDVTAFDPDDFLASSGLVADTVYRCGERRPGGGTQTTDGFSVLVSDQGESGPDNMVQAAVDFLRENGEALTRLRTLAGRATVLLDFGYDFPTGRAAARFFRLPLPLLESCAALGVEIEISVYASR
jgi:hypothetical protein